MLINSVLYERGRKVRDIRLGEGPPADTNSTGGFVWGALKDATEEELNLVQSRFALHELAVEDARVGEQRPKIDE